jgi:ribose transport system ATP-binding protein
MVLHHIIPFFAFGGPVADADLILELKDLTKSFPGVAALSDVSFSVRRGDVHALVGENGAGKSTLIKILSGVQQKDSGQIFVGGQEVHIPTPMSAMELGITCIYQELPLARSLSVADNIFLGQETIRYGFLNKARQNAAARKAFAEFDIDVDPRAVVGTLSVSMQQITAIIKSMMKDAKIFIMDEPTATLGEHETERLFDFISRLKIRGITVLYISHRLDEIFGIADRVTVLRDGYHVGTRPISDVDRNELVTMMSGKSLSDATFSRSSRVPGDKRPVLQVSGLCYGSLLSGISFTLQKGEIFGITGLVGAGKTEILKCLYGLLEPSAGEILLPGGDSETMTAAGRKIGSGSFIFGLVPEDRKRDGLFLDLDIARNISISCLAFLTRLSYVLNQKENALAEQSIRDLDIRARGISQRVKFLSGGNQQKVILARWLSSKKTVLLLDEPTRGVDVVAKTEIYKLLEGLAARGLTILLASCDVGEVLGVSDRLATLRNGRIVRIYERETFDKQKVLHDILFDQEPAGRRRAD